MTSSHKTSLQSSLWVQWQFVLKLQLSNTYQCTVAWVAWFGSCWHTATADLFSASSFQTGIWHPALKHHQPELWEMPFASPLKLLPHKMNWDFLSWEKMWEPGARSQIAASKQSHLFPYYLKNDKVHQHSKNREMPIKHHEKVKYIKRWNITTEGTSLGGLKSQKIIFSTTISIPAGSL